MRTFVADPMDVIGEGLDVFINVRIEMGAGLAFETAALNHVEEMRNDAGFDDALAVFVKVDAPGIAGAFGEQFENVFGGMITPDTRVEAGAFAVWRAGFADVGVSKNALATVEPAIGAPSECVQRFVRVLVGP